MNNIKAEMKGIVCRGLGLLRLDHVSQMDEDIKHKAFKMVDKFEQDLYDMIDGKDVVDEFEGDRGEELLSEPITYVAPVKKKVTRRKAPKKA